MHTSVLVPCEESSVQVNIGTVLRSQGKFANAQEMYEQATAINEKTRGPEHPDTASSISGSALVLKDMGQLDAAFGKYNQALRIQEKTLGCKHPEVAETKVCPNIFKLYVSRVIRHGL